MKLYEISATMQDFLDKVEAGEIPTEAIDDTLEGLEGLLSDKLDDCAAAYKGMIAEAAAIDAEQKQLAARVKAKKVEAERFKSYIDRCLKAAAGGKKPEKMETARSVLRYTTSKSLEVDDVAALTEYLHEQGGSLLLYREPELDKTAIKDAIASGEEFPGARIATNFNLQIK